MDSQSQFLLDLIFNKLKNYKARKIYLEKDDLKKLFLLLSKNN